MKKGKRKAVRVVNLKIGDIKIQVKIIPLVEEFVLPSPTLIHALCHHPIGIQQKCPYCKKAVKKPEKEGVIKTICPHCKKQVEKFTYENFCPHCEKVVSDEEVSEGIKVDEGEYITLSEDEKKEIESAFPEETDIHIQHFYHRTQALDPTVIKGVYGLVPTEGGAVAYFHLLKAMEAAGAEGFGYAFINKWHCISLIPIYQPENNTQNYFKLVLLNSPSEIIQPTFPLVEINPDLRQQFLKLVGMLTKVYDPKDFENPQKEVFERIVKEKLGKGEVEKKPPRRPLPLEIESISLSIQETLKKLVPPKTSKKRKKGAKNQ